MNKQELFEKALNEFDEWPYKKYRSMVYCLKDTRRYKAGDFSDYFANNDKNLNSDGWAFVCTREGFEAAKAERSKKYWDGEGDLEKGMVVLLPHPCSDNIEATVVFNDNDLLWVKASTGTVNRIVDIDKCKPIDNRTDKEKAVDELMRDIPIESTIKEVMELAYDKWVGDKK